MIGHQRERLTALGIDIWIPRAEVCLERRPTSLWRDQAGEEIILPIVTDNVMPTTAAPVVDQPISETFNTSNVPASALTAKTAAAELPSQAVLAAPLEIQHIAAFSLQSLALTHCVLLIDATQLTAVEQLLWNNIQRAIEADFAELNWPFVWPFVQDARGASSYVAGFVDAQAVDKPVLQLGAIPYFQDSNAIQLASLQDMLKQPLLKRRLWQLIQNKAHS